MWPHLVSIERDSVSGVGSFMGRTRSDALRHRKLLQGLSPKILDPRIDLCIGTEIMLVVAERQWNEWPSAELEKPPIQFLPHIVVPSVCRVKNK